MINAAEVFGEISLRQAAWYQTVSSQVTQPTLAAARVPLRSITAW